MDEPLFIADPKHDAKAAAQEKSVTSIQSVSTVSPITPIKASAPPAVRQPTSATNASQIGSSSAADIPSTIASLSLYGASPATDVDTDAAPGGYGIPDNDGDNDGR